MHEHDDNADLGRQVQALVEQMNQLRREVAAVEKRLARLEVREELVEAPDAAGDDPVPR